MRLLALNHARPRCVSDAFDASDVRPAEMTARPSSAAFVHRRTRFLARWRRKRAHSLAMVVRFAERDRNADGKRGLEWPA